MLMDVEYPVPPFIENLTTAMPLSLIHLSSTTAQVRIVLRTGLSAESAVPSVDVNAFSSMLSVRSVSKQ